VPGRQGLARCIMAIWQRAAVPAEMEARFAGSLPGHFGIRILEVGEDFLRAGMPVDDRQVQPFGILHGGASVVLAETLGSIASTLALPEARRAAGLEVNANHVAAVPKGEVVTAVCWPLPFASARGNVSGVLLSRAASHDRVIPPERDRP
jgi:1,4-dihydroxy-2-naphthoyl-CoA hydrolase